MFKLLCVLAAVLGLASAQTLHTYTQITAMTVSTDSIAVGNLAATTYARAYAGEAFVFTITGKGLKTGDRIAWVKNADTDCANAGATTGTAGVAAVALTCNAAGTSCTSASTSVPVSSIANQASYNNYMRLCYSRQASDAYGNALTTSFPWQYYGTYFRFGITNVDSWKDPNDALVYAANATPIQRFWATQTTGKDTLLAGQNIFDGDKIRAVVASGSATATCATSVSFASCATGNDECTSITSSKFTSDIKLTSGTAKYYFLCYNRANALSNPNSFDTGLRAQSVAFSGTSALQFMFPTQVLIDTTNKNNFVAGTSFRAGMFAVRGGDKFFFLSSGTATPYDTCANAKTGLGGAISTNPWFTVSAIEYKSGIRTAKLSSASVTTKFTDATLAGMNQLTVCYWPEGTGTNNVVSGGIIGITGAQAPWYSLYTNCDPGTGGGNNAGITAPANGLQFLMADDFTYPTGTANTVLLSGVANTLFYAGCVTANSYYGVSAAACSNSPAASETGMAKITDPTWPQITITPIATSATTYKLCGNGNAINIGGAAQITYQTIFSSAGSAITRAGAGSGTNDVFIPPSVLASKSSDKSAKWFMSGWQAWASGGTAGLGSALNFWTGDGTTATTKYNGGTGTAAGTVKTDVIFTATSADDFACSVDAVNAVRFGSSFNSFGAADGSADSWIGNSNLRTATAITCDPSAVANTNTQSCLLGTNTTPDVGAKRTLTMCVRVYDGTTYVSTWLKTAITVTQYPSLNIFPYKVAQAATTTPNFYVSGIDPKETGLKIGLADIAVTGSASGNLATGASTAATSRCAVTAVLGTVTSGKVAFPAGSAPGQLSTGTTNSMYFCIQRDADTDPYIYQRAAGATPPSTMAVMSSSTAGSYLSPASYTMTDGAGTATAYSPASTDKLDIVLGTSGSVTLVATFSGSDVGMDDTVSPKVSLSASDCTGGTNDVVTGTPTWTNTWVWTDAGTAVSTQSVTSSFAFANTLGATLTTGLGVICWNKLTHFSATGGIRVLRVPSTCTTNCDAQTPLSTNGFSAAIKVDTMGNYIVSGTTANIIAFELTNGFSGEGTADKAIFYSATATGTPSVANAQTVTVASNGPLASTSIAGKATIAGGWTWNQFFLGTAATGDFSGVYNLWIKGGRHTASFGAFNTGRTLTVVTVTGRYPGSFFTMEATNLYFAHTGLATGGNFFLYDAACPASTSDYTAVTTGNKSNKLTMTVGTNGAASAAITALGTAPGSTVTYKYVCWQPPAASAGNFFLQVGSFATAPSIAGYATAPTSLSSDLPIASLGANLYTLEKQNFPFVVTIATANTGVGYIQDDYSPLLIDGSKSCNTEVSGTNNAVKATSLKKIAETDNTVSKGSTLTFPNSLTAGKATSYKVCWTGKKTAAAAADWTDALATTINVRAMPTGLVGTAPFVLVGNVESSYTQKVTLSYVATVVATDKLQGTDTACLVPKGRAGPSTSASAVPGTISLTDATGSYSIYCALAGASDVVDYSSIVQSLGSSARGDYDLWVAAGAVAGSLAIPAQVSGVVVTIVVPDFRPRVAFTGAARTFFTDLAGDSYTLSDTAAGCSSATTFAATTGSGNTISFTATPSSAATQYVCYSPVKSSTIKVAVRTTLTGYDASTASATNTLDANTAFGAAVTGTDRYVYIQDNIDTTYWFSYTASGTQPGDIFKVMKYESAYPATGTGKNCEVGTPGATDFYGDNTANGGWNSAPSTSGSMWVTIAKLPATSGATGSTNQNLPFCWFQKSNSLRNMPGTPTGMGVRVVDVNTFQITVSLNGFPGVVRAVSSYTRTKFFFAGHWIDANDAVSFVPRSSSDCSQAWYYENLLNGPTPTATTPTMISAAADFSTTFEGGLPGGSYYLCYNSWHTKTGYRFYSDLTVSLRSIDASIMPLTASSGIATTFTLTTYAENQLKNSYWRDNVPATLMNVNDKGQLVLGTTATACAAANASLSTNFTAAGSITATLTTTNPTDTFQPCVDFYSGPALQAIACNVYGATCGSTTGNYSPFVTVYSSAKVVTYRPATIPRGRPTDLVFHGSFLNKGGQDAVYLNTTASCNGTFTTLSTAGVAAEQNQAMWPAYLQQVPGAYAACYKFFLNATTPVATGINVVVAGVDSIAPTGIDAATFLGGGSLTLTLTGFFNQFQSTNLLDNDYVGLVPRVAAKRDCSGLNMTAAVKNPVIFSGSSATATTGTVVKFDITDAPAANDYSLCVHFAGMPWTGDVAKDFVLIDQSKVTFSLRQVNQFLPRTIVNNTNTVVSFFGFGLGNDTVGWVASTADCTAAAPAATSQAPVVGGKATLNLAAGSYRVCYKFKDSTAWFNVLTNAAADNLVAKAAVVDTLTVKVKGVAVTSKTWDMVDSAKIVLAGTGLSTGDKARLVNYTNPLVCDVTTGYVPVVPEDPLNNANFFIDAPAGSIANGTYGLCYQWASGAKVAYNDTTFKMTVTNGPRLLGVAPRMVPANSSATFLVVGQALTATDKAALVAAGTACPAAGTTQVSSVVVPLAARTVVSVTLALTGATNGGIFTLCYYPSSTPTVAQQLNNAIFVNDPQTLCPASKKFRCGASCQATPCAPVPADFCSNNPLAVICPATGFCARSADECFGIAGLVNPSGSGASLPACTGATPQRCFDGSCSMNLLTCPPVSPPPQSGVRCADGSNAASTGACAVTTKACTGITGTNTYCGSAGGCPVGGVSDLNQCPPADGCPVGLQRCSDCTCQADCSSRSFPRFLCADGTSGVSRQDCQKCWRHAKFAPQVISTKTTGRRRFVVRASAALAATNLVAADGTTIATIQIDQDLAKDDGCTIGIYSIAESVVDSTFSDPTVGYLAGPTVYIGIMNNASTGACNLDSTKFVTITYPQLESPVVNCGVYIGNATVAVGTGSAFTCKVSGSTLLGVGVAPYFGTAAPKTFVVPSASASTPTPSSSALPSTGTSTAPGGSVTPSGAAVSTSTAPGTTTSASIAVSASTLLVAIALSLLALLI